MVGGGRWGQGREREMEEHATDRNVLMCVDVFMCVEMCSCHIVLMCVAAQTELHGANWEMLTRLQSNVMRAADYVHFNSQIQNQLQNLVQVIL